MNQAKTNNIQKQRENDIRKQKEKDNHKRNCDKEKTNKNCNIHTAHEQQRTGDGTEGKGK